MISPPPGAQRHQLHPDLAACGSGPSGWRRRWLNQLLPRLQESIPRVPAAREGWQRPFRRQSPAQGPPLANSQSLVRPQNLERQALGPGSVETKLAPAPRPRLVQRGACCHASPRFAVRILVRAAAEAFRAALMVRWSSLGVAWAISQARTSDILQRVQRGARSTGEGARPSRTSLCSWLRLILAAAAKVPASTRATSANWCGRFPACWEGGANLSTPTD